VTDQPATRKLTHRERLFVETYLTTWQQTAAAKAAGYAHPEKAGWLVQRRPAVKAAIDARLDEAAMKANEVLARLSQQARANIAEFISEELVEDEDENGNPITVRVFSLNWQTLQTKGYLVKKISNTANGVAIELHDGQNALITLGKHHKLFADQVELPSEITLKIIKGVSMDEI
jgi:hypothetical protein